ncbi:MAG: hypothetical protein LM564_04260 [Desulfurococcaceae archaeon]|nr:hypothetical protein [Desulfurococcaceae archaeon]
MLAIELSRVAKPHPLRKKEKYSLAPHVLDALSSALKQFVDKLVKYRSTSPNFQYLAD